MVRTILFFCAIVAGCSFVAAYALDSIAQRIVWKRRAVIASLAGGMIPTVLLGVAFYASGDPRTQNASIYVVLAVIGIIFSLAVGYPTAFLFTRRCERSRQPDVFK